MTHYMTPLTRDDLAAEGIPEPWHWGIRDRTRFGELDTLNHVNNAVYFNWLENARIAYFDDMGFDRGYKAGLQLVLTHNAARYIAPIHLREDYVITLRTASFRRTSFKTEYAIWVNGALKTTAETVMVCVGTDVSRKLPIPESVKAHWLTHDGAQDERQSRPLF